MSRIRFMNTTIDSLTMDEVLHSIDELICKKSNSYVVTPNVDHIVRLENDIGLQEAYKKADLILADGKPLIWISKWYGRPIKEKISGSDLFPKLCEMAEEKQYSIFLLGAAEGVAQKAADKLIQLFPKLQIAGVYSPPVGFEKDEAEIEKIIRLIKEASPRILVVGLGCPKQEIFMHSYCNKLGVPISLGLGASIDFMAGTVKRAPRWVSNCGFEWLYRFLKEPKRLFKRYFFDDLWIVYLIFKYRTREL